LKRAASGASDVQTALHVVQHCTTCTDCAEKLKEYAKLFSSESPGDIQRLKTSKPEWQKEFARQLAASQKAHSRQLLYGMAGWALAGILMLAVGIGWYAQQDSIGKVNREIATAFTDSRNIDLRLPGAEYSELKTDRASALNNRALAEAKAAIERLRPSMKDSPEFLDAEGRAELVSNDVQGAYDKLKRARAKTPNSAAISTNLAIAECLIADNGQPESYQVAYELLSQVLEADSRDATALFNRAVVSERLREYQAAVDDWSRLLEVEPKGGWADEARKRKAADEELRKSSQLPTGAKPSDSKSPSGK
jgi:cytochrome c-type biogenesis protein CcmH/NrfG